MEKEKILIVGKYQFDISNISVYKSRIAKKKWNVLLGYKVDSDGVALRDTEGNIVRSDKKHITSTKKATRKIISIGFYLIRQEFKVLKRRFSFWDTVKEFIRRYFITIRYVESLTEQELNVFVEWVTEVLTGEKKKTRNFLAKVMEDLDLMLEGMSEKEILTFQTYVLTSLGDSLGEWKKLKATPKVS